MIIRVIRHTDAIQALYINESMVGTHGYTHVQTDEHAHYQGVISGIVFL